MFTRKTNRQSACTSTPPSGGPVAAAMPPVAAHTPIPRWRSVGANSGSMRPSDVGSISAPPAACTTRAPIRKPTDGASAHAALASRKTVRPSRNARLRPKASAQRPAGTSSAAKTIAYPLRIHESDASDAPPNCFAIDGNAMFTMNRSRLDMKTPTHTINVTAHFRCITRRTASR